VVANDRTFGSNTLEQNATFSFTFDKGGQYPYFCSLHPNMVGTVVVSAGIGGSFTTIGLIVGVAAAAIGVGAVVMLKKRSRTKDQDIP
jgi:hypothetical protein